MNVKCPGCHVELKESSERGATLSRCGKCNKVWIDLGQLDRYVAAVERHFSAAEIEALRTECRKRREALLAQSVVMYLHCPACNQRMLRRAFGGTSGIITQVCTEHGVLMAGADLQAIEDFVRRGGEVLVKEAEKELLDEQLDAARSDLKAAERQADLTGRGASFWYVGM